MYDEKDLIIQARHEASVSVVFISGVAEFCYEMGVAVEPPPPFHSPDLQRFISFAVQQELFEEEGLCGNISHLVLGNR